LSDIKELERKVLKFLFNHPWEYVPGRVLQGLFGVDHNTLQKIINRLRRKGFIIFSHRRKGYLFKVPDDLSRAQDFMISALVGGFWWHAEYFSLVTSTRDMAKEYAEDWGVPSGFMIVAEEMTDAKGRFGKRWYAPEGGLWFTIVLRPKRFDVLALIPIAMTAAIADAIKLITDIAVKIRWPNDIIHNNRKLGIIVVEPNIYYDRINYVLLSVFLNVNNKIPKNVSDIGISLKELWGKPVPRVVLYKVIIHHFAQYYYYLKVKLHNLVLNAWRRHSETLGRYVRIETPAEVIEGRAIDISSDNALVIKCKDGREILVYPDEVRKLTYIEESSS